MPEPPTDCSPATVLADTHCLDCLSQTELKSVLFLLWATAAGYTMPDDLDTLLEQSACNECGLNGNTTRRMIMEIVAMANGLIPQEGVPEVASKMRCLPCLQPGQIDAMISFLKCKYWASVTPG